MSNQLGPITVECDAPPYSIVEGCYLIGFQAPEDVRWCRMSHFRPPPPWRALLSFRPWRALRLLRRAKEPACSCGEKLRRLRPHDFVNVTGDQTTYLLGQCRRCRTIFWDEA